MNHLQDYHQHVNINNHVQIRVCYKPTETIIFGIQIFHTKCLCSLRIIQRNLLFPWNKWTCSFNLDTSPQEQQVYSDWLKNVSQVFWANDRALLLDCFFPVNRFQYSPKIIKKFTGIRQIPGSLVEETHLRRQPSKQQFVPVKQSLESSHWCFIDREQRNSTGSGHLTVKKQQGLTLLISRYVGSHARVDEICWWKAFRGDPNDGFVRD